MSFAALGLSAPLVRAVADQNYLQPTPIQTQAIPVILRGTDVLASAQTGSGKTATFLLPLLQQLSQVHLEKPRPLRALILAPTRELAIQIGEAARAYALHLPQPLKIVSVFGGVSVNPQMMALRGGADMVVATPGRLLDLIDHNALHLAQVTTLVLDEADRLFDLGFTAELTRILALLPARRQNLLFSATLPDAVVALANILLHEPLRIAINNAVESVPTVVQRAIVVDNSQRTQLLRHLIQQQQWSRLLVFVSTKYATEHVAEKLRRAGINASALHGELTQGARTQALVDFKASKLQVLVATDIAARGIDIVQMPVVVNYDLPRSADDYIHRIGRTARAGDTGLAISLVTINTEMHFRLIEKRHGLRLSREQIAGFEVIDFDEKINASIAAAADGGGIKGKRKSKKDKLREVASRSESELLLPKPADKPGFIWPRITTRDS